MAMTESAYLAILTKYSKYLSTLEDVQNFICKCKPNLEVELVSIAKIQFSHELFKYVCRQGNVASVGPIESACIGFNSKVSNGSKSAVQCTCTSMVLLL